MKPWKEIEKLIPVFKSTFNEVIDFDKFNAISITFHSTALEGSTLTIADAELLLDKGLTPKGKPIEHQQMVLDHHNALKHTLSLAEQKTPVTPELIQKIAAMVMKSTGAEINTVFGTYDSSKGDLRLNNVRAGDHYFVNYDKVKPLFNKLATKINESLPELKTTKEILDFAFTAHHDMVSIHPFADGNGRTARLLMNYIQHYHNLPISPVFSEDRNEYIQALRKSESQESIDPFISFMEEQYLKYLKSEISNFQSQINKQDIVSKKQNSKGKSLLF